MDSSLKYHLMEARKNGVTRTEMAEILTHIAFYAGWPNAWAAFHIAVECPGHECSNEWCEPVSDAEYQKL
ncbi:MAG: carboxymuconolactone decarboxylase family protein [Selenomonadaceae bacterium]|nr:carboxymuconolactone decarboxylase family protein [Selenomonadaceae bacterium]